MSGAWPEIVRAVAGRYGSRLHAGFVAGKLRHDPVYAALFAHPGLEGVRSVVDLGCGRGILLALLAERARRSGRTVRLQGIEARPSHAEVARAALGQDARIRTGDLLTAEIPAGDAVCLIDVLHYLPEEAHAPMLQDISRALAPGGVLLIREIDGTAGARGWLARTAEHGMSALRGEPGRRFAFRSTRDWRRLLTGAGFSVAERSMDEGTPFANVLLVGRRP
ncbi:MAG TPA: class I SAM-dependent methyltransferase [Candidatus Polarisedimenticolaceae bacterium]|nr:class I SAM-dependent methyltransferase [Candidatus Polarisedimenticolaceae bacterium]